MTATEQKRETPRRTPPLEPERVAELRRAVAVSMVAGQVDDDGIAYWLAKYTEAAG